MPMIPPEWVELLKELPGWLSLTIAVTWLSWWFRKSKGVSHHDTVVDNTGAVRRIRDRVDELEGRVRTLEKE